MLKKLLLSTFICCLAFFASAQSWDDLNKEVLNFLNKGDYNNALTVAMKAKDKAQLEYGLDHPDYSASLHNLASAYKKLGRYEDAEPLYWEALRIDKQVLGVKHQNYALSLFGLANLYKLKKDPSKAQAIYYDALDIMRRAVTDRHPDYSLILSDYGDLFTSLKKYDKAENHLNRAKNITKNAVGETHQDYAGVLLNIGKLQKAKGDIDGARSTIEDALAIYKSTAGDMHPDYLDCKNYLENLSDPNYQLYPAAVPSGTASTAQVEVKTDGMMVDPSIPQSTNSGSFPKVEVDQSMKTPNTEGTTVAVNTRPTNTAPSVADLPSSTIVSAPQEVVPPPPPPAPKKKTWKDYSSMMDDYSQSGDYTEAIAVGEKAMRMVKEEYGESHENYAWVSQKMAANYMNAGMKEKAIPIYEKDLAMIELKMGTDNQVYRNRVNELMDLYRATGQQSKADAFFTKNIYQSLSQVSSTNAMDRGRLIGSLDDQISDFYATSKSNGSATVGNELQNYNLILKGAAANGGLGIDMKPMGDAATLYQKLQKKLGVNEAAIDFMKIKDSSTGTSRYHALVTRFKGSETVVVPLADDYKIQSILSFKADSPDSYANNSERSQQLYQLIWQPLEEHLKGINTVAVSPVGSLEQVAFGALLDNSKNVLSEMYNLHFYSSMRDYINKGVKRPVNRSVVFFGGAEFGSNGSINYMPSTKDEVNTFQTICNAKGWTVESNVGAEATEAKAKMKEGNDAPGVLHLATPVYLNEEVSKIGMALNNANTAITSGTVSTFADDGMLTGKEIAAMDLTKTNLVILSATETDAVGIGAMHQAFKAAGVDAVLFSQWKTPDKQTQELLTLFYIYHLTGMTPHKALSTAQKEIKHLYPSPYYWAGFMIME